MEMILLKGISKAQNYMQFGLENIAEFCGFKNISSNSSC